MLEVLAVKGRAPKGSALEKLRKVLPGFSLVKSFINSFARTTKLTSEIMETLKTMD